MVGLSIVLESHQKSGSSGFCGVYNKTNMVVNKYSSSSNNPFLASSSSSSSSGSFLPFLEHCFLCGQKLLPGKDIYMYKGDRGFCSVECRYRQIFMDEEDGLKTEKNCSISAIKPSANSAASSNPNYASNSRHQRKNTGTRAGGFVAY